MFGKTATIPSRYSNQISACTGVGPVTLYSGIGSGNIGCGGGLMLIMGDWTASAMAKGEGVHLTGSQQVH